MKLFHRSKRKKDEYSRFKTSISLHRMINIVSAETHEQLIKLSIRASKRCEVCRCNNRVNSNLNLKRKPLQELNPNSLSAKKRRNRTLRSNYGCALCNIHLCNNKIY